jgi:hypothetical protein
MAIPAYKKAIKFKTTGSTTWLSMNANDASFNLGAELLDDTDFTSTGFRSRLPGLKDYSIDATAFWDSTNSAFNTLRNALLNETKLDFQYLPNGVKGFQGQAYIENFAHSGDVGSLETVDVTLQSASPSLTTV